MNFVGNQLFIKFFIVFNAGLVFSGDSGDAKLICKSIANGVSDICNYGIEYPTGASVKYCTQRVPIPDDCVSKEYFKYPCPTLADVSKQCKGWTCVPGTIMEDRRIPCGIEIDTDSVSVCSNNIKKIADKAITACSCLGNLMVLMDGDGADLVQSDDATETISRSISRFTEGSTCLAESGLNINDNKHSQLSSIQSIGDNFYIQLPEIDSSTYADLILRVVSCASAGNCELIGQFFIDYLKNCRDAVMSGFQDFINNYWLAYYQSMPDSLRLVTDTFSEVSESEIDTVANCFMEQGNGNSEAFRSMMSSISAFISAGNDITRISDGVQNIMDLKSVLESSVNNLVKNTNMVSLARTVFLQGGDLNAMMNSIMSLQQIGNLNSKLGSLFSTFNSAFTNLNQIRTEIDNLGFTSSGDTCFSSSPKVSSAIFASMLLHDALNLVVRKPGGGQVKISAGLKSYNRWVKASFDVPCTRTGKKCYKVQDWKKCLSYPEVYPCGMNVQVPLPNHHVPFVKLTLES
jgi:hypothetical protein